MTTIDIKTDITKDILSSFDNYRSFRTTCDDKYLLNKGLFTSHEIACFRYLEGLRVDELAALKGQSPTEEEEEVLNFFTENETFSENFPPHLKAQYGKAIMRFLIKNFDVQTGYDYYSRDTKKVINCDTQDSTIVLCIED